MNLTGQKASSKPQKPIPNKGLRNHVESKPCCVCGKRGTPYNRIVCHHIDTGGMGTSGVDEKNMLPTHYYECHTGVAHSMTVENLSKKVGRDLRAYAIYLTEEYEALQKDKQL